MRHLRILFVLCCLISVFSAIGVPLQAEEPDLKQTTKFTATGTGTPLKVVDTGVNQHKFSYFGEGTVSTCSVKLEQSGDGITWSDLIAATTCTSNGTSPVTAGTANYIRVNLGTLSGGGQLTIVYSGYRDAPSGSVTITTFPDNEPFNLAQYNGSAVGATNGLHVQPGTSAVFTVTGSGTAGSAAAGVVSVQGIASMTPVQVSQATATNLNAAVVGTGTAGTPAGNILTVQGVTSMTPVQVSQATASNLNAQVVGSVAVDSAAAGNPVTVGGEARTTFPTAVSDADVVRFLLDKYGRNVPTGMCPRDLMGIEVQQNTNSTSEETIVTAAASEHHDLMCLIATNATATAVTATIKDSTAGTTRMVLNMAANGGAVICPGLVWGPQQAAVNNNWTATLSALSITVDWFVTFCKTP